MSELILNFNERCTVTLVRDGECVGEVCLEWTSQGLKVEAIRHDEAEVGPFTAVAP